jgi:hypothetical protein
MSILSIDQRWANASICTALAGRLRRDEASNGNHDTKCKIRVKSGKSTQYRNVWVLSHNRKSNFPTWYSTNVDAIQMLTNAEKRLCLIVFPNVGTMQTLVNGRQRLYFRAFSNVGQT